MDNKLRDKLETLQVMVVDKYIDALEDGSIHPRDFAPIITLLNHNKVVAEAEKEEGTHKKVKRMVKK